MPATRPDLLELFTAFPPRPVRSQEELERTSARLRTIRARGELTTDERDYCTLLCLVIQHYEKEHYPPEPISDADLLRSMLEDADMTQTQLAAATGIADSTISEILKGKRAISKGHIAALVRVLEVSPVEFFSGRE